MTGVGRKIEPILGMLEFCCDESIGGRTWDVPGDRAVMVAGVVAALLKAGRGV